MLYKIYGVQLLFGVVLYYYYKKLLLYLGNERIMLIAWVTLTRIICSDARINYSRGYCFIKEYNSRRHFT